MIKKHFIFFIIIFSGFIISNGVYAEGANDLEKKTTNSDEELMKNLPDISSLPAELRESIKKQDNELKGIDYSNVEVIKVNSVK